MTDTKRLKRKIWRRKPFRVLPRDYRLRYKPEQRRRLDEIDAVSVENEPMSTLLVAVTREKDDAVELLTNLGITMRDAATAVAVISRLAVHYVQSRFDVLFDDSTVYPPDYEVGEVDLNLDGWIEFAKGDWGGYVDYRDSYIDGGNKITFTPAWEVFTDPHVPRNLLSKRAQKRASWRAAGFRQAVNASTGASPEDLAVPGAYAPDYKRGVEEGQAFLRATAWLADAAQEAGQ